MSDATEDHQAGVNLQHPSLPADLAEQSDATLQATLNAAAAAAAAAQQQQQDGAGDHQEVKDDQNGAEQAANESNFFDYSFPNTSTALDADGNTNGQSSFPFATHPHPQHPHLGVEALGHAAAASEHVPGVTSAEGDHVYDNTNGDQTMEMTMTTNQDDSMEHAQQDRSSGKAGRNLSVPASDGGGEGKKNTPYSRSPDMRNSHKLAERKRRKEMKDLFDELRDEIPNERGPKTSKWEILQKAVEYVRALRKERDDFASELAGYRGETVPQDEAMGGDDEPQPPPAAPEGDADDYAKYEEQQAASQQQLEAAAAAANQFYEGEPTEHQEVEYKEGEQQAAEADQATEQDWQAIAQVAQQAQAQTAQ